MQWLFMVIGGILGLALGDSPVLGGVAGLALGQALALHQLQSENRSLHEELAKLSRQLDSQIKDVLRRIGRANAQLTGESTSVDMAASPAAVQQPATPQAAAPQAPVAPADIFAPSGLDTLSPQPPQAPMAPPPAIAVPAPAMPAMVAAQPIDLWRTSAPAAGPGTTPDSTESAMQWDPGLEAELNAATQATTRVQEAEYIPPPTHYEAPPQEPALLERGLVAARNWLFGGNTVLRVGAVLLFIGLAFLLRYASERVAVPVELRYMGVALAALVLLVIGWRLREKRSAYGLMLQGTGIAVLYLTIFAALRLHPLISPVAAFGLLVVVTVCLAILAVLQNAVSLAVAAVLGGFAAPILTSTGSGNHVALFSYFALLNAGIFAIAWYRAWRLLNLVGFLGTFGIGCAWGLRSYQPALFASTEPFLLLFFLMYVGIGLLFARRKLLDAQRAPQERKALLRWSARQADYIDATLLFGPPIIGFGLQCAVVQHIEYGMAFSALALGLFYMVLARVVHGSAQARNTSLLTEVFLALGVIFGTLAIPLAFDAQWTSAAWAVEGAGLYWLGLRQRRRVARMFALFLQAAAAVAFLSQIKLGTLTVLDGSPLGALMLGAAFLFSFLQLRAADDEQLADLELFWLPPLACIGLAFLYLIAPLTLGINNTAMAWAIAGVATLFAGLRLYSRSFMLCAFAIQLLGAALFLLNLRLGDGQAAVFSAGWQGLATAMLIGVALIAGMLIAVREPLVQDNPQLLYGLNLALLIGLVFINLAVLYILPWRSASAVWAASGLLILWLGLQLRQSLAFYFGLALQVVGGVAFIGAFGPALFGSLSGEGLRPLAHSGFWTPALLALAAFVGAWRLQRASQHESDMGSAIAPLSTLLLMWGATWWAFAAASEIIRFAPATLRTSVALGSIALSIALWSWLAWRERWPALATLCLALMPCAAFTLVSAWHWDYQPLADFGWLAWPLLFAVHLASLRYLAPLLPSKLLSAAHILGCWLLLSVLALELCYLFALLAEYYNAWRWLGWALVPSAYLLLVSSRWTQPWPLREFGHEYRRDAAAPVALLMLAWFWLANAFSNGAADPLPYIPLVNPLEIGLLLVLFALYRWGQYCLVPEAHNPRATEASLQALLGLSLFALLTMAVCRAVHHLFGVPFRIHALGNSMLVQAGLSLLWTLLALALMVAGTRLKRRDLWFSGGILVGIVVVKMFFIELGNSGSLERIISFIGVGVLLLVVGYFSPLPPRRSEAETETLA